MTLAATGTCDGCEREGPVQQLERVLLPSGRTAVCCPECRHQAEKLAERSSSRCQACGDEVTVADLSVVGLPDGRAVQICPRCLAAAKGDRAPEGPRASIGQSPEPSASGRARSTPDRGGAGHSSQGTESGAGGTLTADRESVARGDAESATGSAAGGTSGAGAPSAARTNGGAAAATADQAAPEAEHECEQCGRRFAEELYRVVTIDERTEELCAECKDECLDRGIITEVELKRAQALEVLGLDGDADEEEIRGAYLDRVKSVHPDRPEGSRSEFMLVKQAYERLSEE